MNRTTDVPVFEDVFEHTRRCVCIRYISPALDDLHFLKIFSLFLLSSKL